LPTVSFERASSNQPRFVTPILAALSAKLCVSTPVLAKHPTQPWVKQLSLYCDKRRPPIL